MADWRIRPCRFLRAIGPTVALTLVCGSAFAQDFNWQGARASLFPPAPVPAYLGSDVWARPAVQAPSVENPRFADVSTASRPDPEAILVAVRADLDRLSTPDAEIAPAMTEASLGQADGRVGEAFERFAALDGARSYGSRGMAHGSELAVARDDPRAWTPAASLALVAFDLPRD